jgi:hypothetical protein
MKYVLIFYRAMERAYAIGPFDSEAEAQAWAEANHKFPQIWTVGQLRPPGTMSAT